MSKSPSLRRIQADIRELALDPSDRYHAAPLENDMFEWHFTIRGANETDFAGGIYHGRILLPPEYPFKPPHIIFLTPSGRFDINTKICLSFSAFHPELWQPAWGIRLILEALISFLPTPADGALGALNWSAEERKKLAQLSQKFYCTTCHCQVKELLPPLKNNDTTTKIIETGSMPSSKIRFQKEIMELQRLQMQEHAKPDTTTTTDNPDAGTHDGVATKEVTTLATTNVTAATTTEIVVTKSGIKEILSQSTDTRTITRSNVKQHQCNSLNENVDTTETNPSNIVATTTSTTTPSLVVAATNAPATTPIFEEDGTDTERMMEAIDPMSITTNPPPPLSVNNNGIPSLLDPLLHGSIVLLSILCYFLLCKGSALMADLRELQQLQQQHQA